MRYILTVNRASIDADDGQPAIRVEDTKTGNIFAANNVEWTGYSRMVFDPENERQDGARAWVETDGPVRVMLLN